jgi:elongation factor Ts
VEPGVVEKIAAMASRDHGDARKAVALLAKSAYLAEKAGSKITLMLVDSAAAELDQDRYLTLLRSAPAQLQAAMAGVIGEKLELGRVGRLDGTIATYMHRRAADLPPQVGVLVAYEGSEDTARQVGMQIAAMRPEYLTREDVPADVVANEQRIAEATAREEGKPEGALPKIIEGRVNGFFKDRVLLEQSSVQDSKKTVKAFATENGAEITGFVRIEIGG